MNKRSIEIRILITILGSAFALSAAQVWARDDQFSLTSVFGPDPSDEGGSTKSANMLTPSTVGKYSSGPWEFKLIVPDSGTASMSPGTERIDVVSTNSAPSLSDTQAAASYNIYSGDSSNFGVNLTGKVKFGLADNYFSLNSGQNDYAAQADAYQSFDKFKALGSLGYRIPGENAGISLNRVIYGSVGGAYQLNDQISGGVDFSLSQSPAPIEPGRRQISAYVSHNINKTFKAKGYLLENFSNGNPDHSVGAAVSYGF